MRVAQVIGKLAAAGVEAVVNNYYCSMNMERIQFDYFIDEDSELAPPQEMIDRGARYFVVPSTRHAAARVRALTALFRENHYAIVHAHMNRSTCRCCMRRGAPMCPCASATITARLRRRKRRGRCSS